MASAEDPRIARTRRDVIDAAAELLTQSGWGQVSHSEVARRSGYAKATIYTHWPTRLDLVRDAVDRICDASSHPALTGDLRADLIAGLRDFADDLSAGSLARVVGGVIERSGGDPVIDRLRQRLYEKGTNGLRAVLLTDPDARDVEPVLAMLTGAVLVRVAFEGRPADAAFIRTLVDRALARPPAQPARVTGAARP